MIKGTAALILSTHAIVGGAIASLMPSHPLLAAVAGFASHFAIDAIPHWDYPLQSIAIGKGADNRRLRLNRNVVLDLAVIALDACAGLALALWLFATPGSLWVYSRRRRGNAARSAAVCTQPVSTRAVEYASALPWLDPRQTKVGLEAGRKFADGVRHCRLRAGGHAALTMPPGAGGFI